MDSHPLVEMAHMLHRICSTIVDGEHWLIESPRKSCPFNPTREWWFGNLVQRLAYGVISQAFARRALIPSFVAVLLLIEERLTRWGSWPSSITRILSIIKGSVRVGGGSPSLCMVQFSLQLVNLQLQGSSILLIGEVALSLGLTSIGPDSMHAPLPIPSTLEVDKRIFTLGPYRLCLVRT